MIKKRIKIPILAAFFVFSTLSVFARNPKDFNCYTILVGKNASADGSVIVAHNEDDWGDNVVNVRRIPPHDYGPIRSVALGQGAIYETDGRTNGFLWIEIAPQEYSDAFVNEYGVVVVSDSCPTRETKGELTDGGIGYMLRRLIGEKARTAREAITLAGGLIEKYGYQGSGRTYSIADKNEAWMLAAVRGRHWIAQRVPDDEVAILPNHMTIRQIRLDDPANFLTSRDIVTYAAANSWYDKEKDGPFDFKKAYTLPAKDLILDANVLRHWRGLSLLTGREWPIGEDYPFSVKPMEKVTVEKLMSVLRDHYEGTPYDATDGYKTGTPNKTKYRTICTMTTVTSLIASLNAGRPEPLSISLWLALGKPDSTVYLPFYYAGGTLPEGLGLGPRTHDDAVFYRQHFEDAEFMAGRGSLLSTNIFELEKTVNADYGAKIRALRMEMDPVERELFDGRKKFEAGFAELSARDEKAALKTLDDYVAAAFFRVFELTKKFLTGF